MKLFLAGVSADTVSKFVFNFTAFTSILFLLVILFFGLYCGYGVLRLRREKVLFPHRLMYPNYCAVDDCTDPVEYYDFILPRITVLSIVMILSGLVQFLSYFIPYLRVLPVSLSVYAVPFVVYLYYSISLRKAAKKFW
ncbi:MAG: hypothetical protein IKT58_05595 [Oscillospiraceae bacterium]|nr:hypothetical protein [Oscillospiraceae bacterium]